MHYRVKKDMKKTSKRRLLDVFFLIVSSGKNVENSKKITKRTVLGGISTINVTKMLVSRQIK
jgi:hypothetical protein